MCQKKLLFRILLAFIFLLFGILFYFLWDVNRNIGIFCFLICYIVVGFDVIYKTIKNIVKLKFLDENSLMFIASFGALFLKQYFEAGAVFLLYQVGELFQNFAVSSSKDQIQSIFSIRPEYANLKVNGKIEKVSPDFVNVGDIILIRPGEKIPLDGVIEKGGSFLDNSSITGEMNLASVLKGDKVFSGSINVSGVLEVRVEKKYSESTVKKILDLIENVSERKSNTENFIKRFAKIYTPIVVFLGLMIFLIPIIFFDGGWKIWFERFLIFLVVSCPCALVISIPVSFFLAISKAAKNGILFKGSIFLELLSNVFAVVFDKTGTLTKGELIVAGIYSDVLQDEKFLEIVCLVESNLNHPISKSIKKAYGKEIDINRVKETKEIFGKGARAVVDGKEVFVGNLKLMQDIGIAEFIDSFKESVNGTAIYLVVERKYCGFIVLKDSLKDNAISVVEGLKKFGVKKIVMLTGDKKNVGESVAKKLMVDEVFCDLLPHQKVLKLEKFIKQAYKKSVVFVGDGVNDAAVIKRADVGIAMGAFGEQAAIEAADVVLMEDDLDRLLVAISIAKNVSRTIKQNIVFSLAFKMFIFILGAFGLTNMWLAIFSDVGVSILAILNSFRALR